MPPAFGKESRVAHHGAPTGCPCRCVAFATASLFETPFFCCGSETLTFHLNVLEYVLLGRAPYLGLLEQPGEEDQLAAGPACAVLTAEVSIGNL